MIRKLLALAFCMAVTPAYAAVLNVSWSHPTSFTDGSPLALAQIASTRIEYGDCSAPGVWGTTLGSVTVTAPATTASVTVPGFGDKCVRGYTRSTAAAGNLESVASGVAFKNAPAVAPNAPVFATPTLAAVYDLKFEKDGGVRLGRVVGEIDAGSVCGSEAVVITARRAFHQINSDTARLYKTPKSQVLVANCVATG